MKRDFIPQDQLSEHDYLFDKSIFPHKWFTGKIKAVDAVFNYLLFCQDLPGADEADPSTWIPAQNTSDNQSSVKYRIGQTVNVKFPDADFSYGQIIGLSRDYVEPYNDLITTDAIHEASAAQSVTFDQLTNKYTIKNGASSVEVGAASVVLSFGTVSLTVNATGITVTNGVITFNILTHTHLSTTPGNPTSPPVIGS